MCIYIYIYIYILYIYIYIYIKYIYITNIYIYIYIHNIHTSSTHGENKIKINSHMPKYFVKLNRNKCYDVGNTNGGNIKQS